MKRSAILQNVTLLITVTIFLMLGSALSGQDTSKGSAPLPESINAIVSVSCMPCHSSKGGAMSRGKLNFNEWTNYSPDKQKDKARDMFKELKKNEMPPKEARERNPSIVLTKEQYKTIKAWANSF